MSAYAGLFRAYHGFSRVKENYALSPWARLHNVRSRHDEPAVAKGNPTKPVDVTNATPEEDPPEKNSMTWARIIEPLDAPGITIIEDDFCASDLVLAGSSAPSEASTYNAQLAALWPGTRFLHLLSSYHRKDTEEHGFSWRENGMVTR